MTTAGRGHIVRGPALPTFSNDPVNLAVSGIFHRAESAALTGNITGIL